MSIAITFRTNNKTTQFRAFLDSMRARVTINDKNAFKESGTAAQTVTVIFQKPHESSTTSPARIEVARQTPDPMLALDDDLEHAAKAPAIVATLPRKQQPAQASLF